MIPDKHTIVGRSGYERADTCTVGEMNLIDAQAFRTEPNYHLACERLQDITLCRLLHSAIGLATESGEFLDMLKKHIYYGKTIDMVNAVEEMGNSTWYLRIGFDAADSSLLEGLLLNVRKLKAQFPGTFTEEKALNRDTTAERVILEGKDAKSLEGGKE